MQRKLNNTFLHRLKLYSMITTLVYIGNVTEMCTINKINIIQVLQFNVNIIWIILPLFNLAKLNG